MITVIDYDVVKKLVDEVDDSQIKRDSYIYDTVENLVVLDIVELEYIKKVCDKIIIANKLGA